MSTLPKLYEGLPHACWSSGVEVAILAQVPKMLHDQVDTNTDMDR